MEMEYITHSTKKKNKQKQINMKYKYIPVDNNLTKAEAFAHTLNNDFILNNQKIKQKDFYIETVDVIKQFQNEGWILKGVAEDKGKNRKIISNYAQLHHPDFSILNSSGKTEALASMTISNSCNGSKPISMDLGAFRLVCSNGMISKTTIAESKLKHTEVNYTNLPTFISNLNNKAQILSQEISNLKNTNLTQRQMQDFAFRAAQARYTDLTNVDVMGLLKVNRREDEGTDAWSVLNRLQESLTHNISLFSDDVKVNQELFSMAESYS